MLIINGVNLRTIGFVLTRRDLPFGPSHDLEHVSVPGNFPSLVGSVPSLRVLRVDGYVKGSSHADLLEAVDDVSAALRGELVIRMLDITDREWVGRLQLSSLREMGPNLIALGALARFDFVVPEPARSQSETQRSGSGALELGTAPSALRIEAGSVSSLTVRVRAGGSGGSILRELVWEGSGGSVVVDSARFTVTAGGDNAIDGLTPESEFPVADPAEGADYLEVSAGDGFYRKRWW